MTESEHDDSVLAEPTLEELESCRKEHARDLKRIEKMTDAQFEAFKRNFELGVLDPTISRRDAIDILRSMICTNLTIQQEKRGSDREKSVAEDHPSWYGSSDDTRE